MVHVPVRLVHVQLKFLTSSPLAVTHTHTHITVFALIPRRCCHIFWQNTLPHQRMCLYCFYFHFCAIVNGIAVVIVLHDFISVYCFCCWFTVFRWKSLHFWQMVSCVGAIESHSNFSVCCYAAVFGISEEGMRAWGYICLIQETANVYNATMSISKHNENGNSSSHQKLCHTIKTFIPTINGHKVLSPSVHLSITLRARTPYQKEKNTHTTRSNIRK